jgi:hypothetical protein
MEGKNAHVWLLVVSVVMLMSVQWGGQRVAFWRCWWVEGREMEEMKIQVEMHQQPCPQPRPASTVREAQESVHDCVFINTLGEVYILDPNASGDLKGG